MSWTDIARRRHDRSGQSYTSGCTDQEWTVVVVTGANDKGRPPVPPSGMRPTERDRLSGGGGWWAQLSNDFSPITTVQYHFYRMRDNSLPNAIIAVLVARMRIAGGPTAYPTLGIIDRQSVKTTEASGPHGYDAGKTNKWCKHHIATETAGNLLGALVHSVAIQDRTGALELGEHFREAYPSLARFFANGGYAWRKLHSAPRARRHQDRQLFRCPSLRCPSLPRGRRVDYGIT